MTKQANTHQDKEVTAVRQRRTRPSSQQQQAGGEDQSELEVMPKLIVWLASPVVISVLVWVATAVVAGVRLPVLTVPVLAVVLGVLAGVVSAVQRRWPGRWLLIPVAAAMVIWAAVALAPIAPAATFVPMGLVLLTGVLGVVLAVRQLVIQRSLPPRRRRGIRRSVFVLAAVAVAVAWLVPAAIVGPWTMPVASAWGVITIAAVVAWSRTAWCRHRMRADQDLRAWPGLAAQLDIAGAVLTAVVWTRAGRSWHIQLPAGRTWRQIRPDQADSVLGVAPGAVTVERNLTSAQHVTVHVQDADPWSGGPIAHPIEAHLEALEATQLKVRGARLPTFEDLPNYVQDPERVAEWLAATASVTDPLPIGERATGDPAGMPVYKPGIGAVHWLVGGQTGGGKSVLMRDLLTGLFRCHDVVVWGIDTAKRGKAFGPWERHMRVARTLEEAEAMLADARVWIQASAEASAREAADGQGVDNVVPSPDRPMLVILIDEGADIFDATGADGDDADLTYACIEHAEKIGATGRSEAVGMVAMFQRPDGTVVPARLRTHFRGGICLRTKTVSELQFVLQGEAAADLDPSIFRHEGLLYLQEDADVVPAPIRSYGLVAPEICARIADVLGPGLPAAPTWLAATAPTNDKAHNTESATTVATGSTEPTAVTNTAEQDEESTNHAAPETPTNTEMTVRPPKQERAGRAGRDLQNMREALTSARAELDQDLDAEQDIEVPEIELDVIAEHHATEPDHLNPTDQPAARALLQALTSAGDNGLQRANVAHHAEVDELTTQRLLGTLERLGHVAGDDGVGPQVRWRIIPRQTPNGHGTPATAGAPGEGS